jgi:hypothetical protein
MDAASLKCSRPHIVAVIGGSLVQFHRALRLSAEKPQGLQSWCGPNERLVVA